MERFVYVAVVQILIATTMGTYVWCYEMNDDYELVRPLYSYGKYYKRVPAYDFGLGKRDGMEERSYEDYSPYNADMYNLMDKKAGNGGNMYSFGLGKRTRPTTYGFGLGKRLENRWAHFTGMPQIPSSRQERRSKIYSFGLGKRQAGFENDDFDSQGGEKRANNGERRFSFGLGKRDSTAQEKASS